MRYDADGKERPEFVLNQEPYRKAQILIAHENFGCGSSREHAPWALLDFGIRCVIAPDFADIFYNNSFKNGILPIRLPRAVCDALMEDAKLGGNARRDRSIWSARWWCGRTARRSASRSTRSASTCC